MGTLVIFNLILILAIVALLVLVKRYIRTERAERILLLVAPLVTIAVHYSTWLFRLLSAGDAVGYLGETPNLLLPIYPCNLVMWCCLIYGFFKNRTGKAALLFSDYMFWFGLFACLAGMFANVDFILDPDLTNYEVTKSILAHATMLFNVLLIPVLGHLRPSFRRNMTNMVIAVLAMYAIGLYCNLIFKALVSAEAAYDVNSMFIIHSPFEGVPFLRYPVIALIALIIYFTVFAIMAAISRRRAQKNG